jgi:VanZ family protein
MGWVLAGAIVWLSLKHQPPQWNVQNGDKLQHALAYASLMFCFSLVDRSLKGRLIYMGASFGLGVALEYVQRAVGYRTFDLMDMAADGFGVIIGFAVAAAVRPLLHSRTL